MKPKLLQPRVKRTSQGGSIRYYQGRDRAVYLINESAFADGKIGLWVYPYAPLYALIGGGGRRGRRGQPSYEDAVEEFGDWLADIFPRYISDSTSREYNDLMADAAEDAGLPWPPPNDAREEYWRLEDTALEGWTQIDGGRWINEEIGIWAENPTRVELAKFLYRWMEPLPDSIVKQLLLGAKGAFQIAQDWLRERGLPTPYSLEG